MSKMTRNLAILLAGLFLFLSHGMVKSVSASAEPQDIQAWTVIFIGDDITADTTWSAGNIYYIQKDVTVGPAATLTIEGGTIVKFWVPLTPTSANTTGLTIQGALRFTGTGPLDTQRVIFTSGRDDGTGGDTNGDAAQTLPAPGDWDAVRIMNWVNTDPAYSFLNIRYSNDGLNFHNTTTNLRDPIVEDNIFVENTCGLTFSSTANGSTLGQVSRNTFTQNKYGLCTRRTGGIGQNNPTLTENSFNNNSVLPIYLFGTSFPTYVDNTFSGYIDPADKLGIGIGGVFNGSGTLPIVNDMPYVFVSFMDITGAGVNVTIPGGAVFKGFARADVGNSTDPLPGLRITGSADVTFESTAEAPITFTSYRDDSIKGDTNGDDIDTEGYPVDWAGVHFVDSRSPGSAEKTLQFLNFRYAVNGLLYETTTTSPGARNPTVSHCNFYRNLNGLHFKAVSNNSNSRIEPLIQFNSFTEHGIIPSVKTDTQPGVPIFLENTIQPSYNSNVFQNNLHPAIGLAGRWRGVATLLSVSGQGISPLPYLVHGEMWVGNLDNANGIDTAANLTIPAGSVIKFFVNHFDRAIRTSLRAAGKLTLESSTGTLPIIFTSYYDSAHGGDTDAVDILPAPRDWGIVLVRQPDTSFSNTLFRYGDKALYVENKSTAANDPFDGQIDHSIFEYNDYGLYLSIQATNDISSLISTNIFRYNSVGLGTFAKDTLTATPKVTGLVNATYLSNQFVENSFFPIYLNGSATLENFDLAGMSNSFLNNTHTAIGLGGYFGAVKPEPGFSILLPKIFEGPTPPASTKLLPYVVWANTNFDWNTPATVQGGLTFKFNTAINLKFYGPLNLQTGPTAINTFTSYKDDTALGDTNADGATSTPARGDWGGVYLFNNLTGTFSYSTLRYADQGLVLDQIVSDPTPEAMNITVGFNTFTENKNGLTLRIESNLDIISLIINNVFVLNNYGMHTYANPNTDHQGTSNPILQSNNFNQHSEFPIYLQGSSNPQYIENLFWDNTHPAIALGGLWCRDATWTKVWDLTFNQNMPYVVIATLTLEIPPSLLIPTINLPDSLIVKFTGTPYIYTYGYLNFQSVPGKEVVFTSYFDDAWGGDINHDGAPVSISRSAWKTVWFMDFPGKYNIVHDLKIYYATAGLGLYYEGPENTQTATEIRKTEFSDSLSGLAMVVGWRQVGSTIYPGKGNINAKLQDLNFHNSNYGILTVVHDKAWGIVNPTLENITFADITNYPIFLGGTSYFSYLGSVSITGTSAVGLSELNGLTTEDGVGTDLALEGLDSSAYQSLYESIEPEQAPLQLFSSPSANLTADPNLYPAIGMAGAWNNTVELAQFNGIPYAVTGNFPLTIIANNFTNYKPANNVTIGAVNTVNSVVAVPAGNVFKFGKDLSMIVKGTLTLLSTETQPVIFTSIKDDSVAGDTNRDGAISRPAKNDWVELRLASTNPFNNAVLRYANKGLHVYFDGAINQNNASSVNRSTFMENGTGISLTTINDGDIATTITNSTFQQNTVHIQGNASNTGKTGHLCIEAHSNDLFGERFTQNGIVNNNLNGPSPALPVDCAAPAFDATQNFWGHNTGPYHPALNTAGLGSRVSDRVAFNPWLTSAVVPPATYTISGRFTKDSAIGDGLPGVLVTLMGPVPGGTTAITDAQGYYSFTGLQNGSYIVSPGLQGYLFNPSSLNVNLFNFDSLESNFIAIISPADVAFLMANVSVLRPTSITPKTYCTFKVTMNKALPAGKSASVDYQTVPGTATDAIDYIAKSGKLTFLAGQSLFQEVKVELRAPNLIDPSRYFYLTLNNPVNGYLITSSATCTIYQAKIVFLPLIKK